MKRNYPLILIDRSKHSSYPFDYITCNDKSVGFIARAIHFVDDISYKEFKKQADVIQGSENTSITKDFKVGGLVIVIEDFFYHFEWIDETRNRIRTLLKKVLKKFLHAEVERIAHGDLDIDNQIKQQQANIDLAKQNYNKLIERSLGDTKHADYMIALAEATLDTLENYRDNMKFINLN